MSEIKIFTGNANPALAEKVSQRLNIPIGKATISRFNDGEIMVEILENVRGREIFIFQSTCYPTNENLMELVIMADAFRRASASSITAIVPYFGYARQDRRIRSARVPITAKVVADMLATVGINRVITVDLHTDQIQGFFYIPVDNVYPNALMVEDMRLQNLPAPLIVSPDVGGVVRARAIAKRLNDSDLAIIDKRRRKANHSEVIQVIGDVKNRDCILVDDIVDTGGTLCNAAKALKENGAASVRAYCTHPVLAGPAINNITHSEIDELVVADSIPLTPAALNCAKIRQLSLAPMLAETIYRINHKESVSSMFSD